MSAPGSGPGSAPTSTPTAPGVARDRWVDAAAAGTVVAGMTHLLAALDHLSHEPRFVVFFLVVGVAQIGLAPHPGREPRPRRVAVALGCTVGLLLLYLASRTVVLDLGPHSDRPEAPDLLGTIVVVSELVALAALLALLPATRRGGRSTPVLVIGMAVWLSWFTGLIG